ncbi:hypothetical protein HQN86_25090 [Pedobacter panaciterrae]|uniref:hypothetical protein n=1 Tax=Pedobacter panaciterrae TaxID=363849 RepID=UPI00155D9D2C|nr:hypothetical protein [Pedobacter panaciterrae]NQX56918.1 hypothetical protein [Pedobacter panaciterrae]
MTEDNDEERPKLYNKATIVIFSILLSTFFGGIIYSQNLSEIDNRKQIAPVLVFCIIWNIILFKLAHRFTDNFVLTFIVPNILGGLVLSILFWKHHFGDLDFKVRSVWLPLVIVLLIYGLFAGFRFLGN